jgi:hypothetical protein
MVPDPKHSLPPSRFKRSASLPFRNIVAFMEHPESVEMLDHVSGLTLPRNTAEGQLGADRIAQPPSERADRVLANVALVGKTRWMSNVR